MSELERLLTVEEVAAWLRVHPASVYRWLRAGDLAGYQISRQAGWRITEQAVRAYLAGRRRAPVGQPPTL